MKVVKPAKIPVLTRIVEMARRPHLHVSAVVAFALSNPRALLDELAFWKASAAALGEQGVFDEGFARVRGELLVAGSFFAPGGKALPASYVRVRLGAIDKRLAVIGDRTWQDGVSSAPAPMTTMPLDWGRAFGGAKFDRNPRGKGLDPVEVDGLSVHPLPNVERYGAVMRSPADRPEPAGFLPMDVTFAQRRERAGSYDKRWFEEHFPGMPPDMAPTFFNVAPEDQWAEGFFRGDEEFLVENMHPDQASIEGRLPGLVARIFVTQKTPEGERFVEIPLACDLVWLFPEGGVGAVVFHGSRRIAEDDAADIVHLVCACEEPGAPRPIDHYQSVLARRLDKDKGAVAGLSDQDLMPGRESGVAPNIGGFEMGRWVRSERLGAQNLRRWHARQLAEAKERASALGLDPAELGELPPEEVLPAEDDLDAIAAHAEAQLLRTDELKRKLDESEAEAKAKARATFAEMGKDYDEVMSTAANETRGPPKFKASEQLARLDELAEEARSSGVQLVDVEQHLADPAFRALLEQQERGLLALYQRYGHFQATADPMSPEARERVRVLVALAQESGESLANRDFTGANLSGMQLSGIDFSGAFLEAVDFSGCDLSRAHLAGAVLAKANLRGANLHSAQLAGANLGGAILEEASFDRADLKDATLTRARLAGARFTDAELGGVHWLEIELGGVDLSGAVLTKAVFIKTDLGGVRFVGADLSEATFVECRLDRADFSRATLRKTSFITCAGEGVSFREARFRQGVIVHGSAFPEADFSDADLEKTNLRGTVLTAARFDRANLDGADLSECDATGASFERFTIKNGMMIRTNLTGASLQGANLQDVLASKSRLAGADFTGANLHRADLSRVVGDAATTFAEAEVGHVRFLPKADVPRRGEA